jgi:hypothetical protein
MRKGFDGLSAEVVNILKADPFSGSLFIFRSPGESRDTHHFPALSPGLEWYAGKWYVSLLP